MREFRPLGNTLFPPVVKNLLIINGIAFLATYLLQGKFQLVENLALFYPTSENFRIWQLVTHIFMHGDIWHLFSNMFALWMFGSIIENYLGSKRFLNYYILCGIGASILYMGVRYLEIAPLQKGVDTYITNPTANNFSEFVVNNIPERSQSDLNEFVDNWKADPTSVEAKNQSISFSKEYLSRQISSPVLGASGAVFGILLAFGMLFPNTLIYIYFFFPMKAKYLVILYGAFELYSGVANNPTDNVAHFAHLGGMLIGFLLLKSWKIKRIDQF